MSRTAITKDDVFAYRRTPFEDEESHLGEVATFEIAEPMNLDNDGNEDPHEGCRVEDSASYAELDAANNTDETTDLSDHKAEEKEIGEEQENNSIHEEGGSADVEESSVNK